MYPDYNAGDSFLYYGDTKSCHGHLGKVTRIEKEPGEENYLYVCRVNGIVWTLTLESYKMKPLTPNWVV